MARRLAWFVGLWAAGVASVALVAFLLRWWLQPSRRDDPPAAAAGAPTPCRPARAGEVLLQRGQFATAEEEFSPAEVFAVVAIATKERGTTGRLGVSRSDLYVWDRRCALVFRQTFPSAPLLRFEVTRLAADPILHIIAAYPGGSDVGYRHLLVRADPPFDAQVLAPMNLFHNSMGGFFVGDLGPGRGPGIALWNARWDSGAHYDPHPATMTLYRWRDGRFAGPEHLATRGPVPAEPDGAPEALGLPFRDSTREERFYPEDLIAEAPAAAPQPR